MGDIILPSHPTCMTEDEVLSDDNIRNYHQQYIVLIFVLHYIYIYMEKNKTWKSEVGVKIVLFPACFALHHVNIFKQLETLEKDILVLFMIW